MMSTPGAANADVSGLWVWEHQGTVPGGDQKQEREEWHVEQIGSKISGYYDRIVHQVSTDGHAYRCSMALEFQIATRYQFSGDVSGDDVRIVESSYEVLSPSACDNGKRRLDVYQGKVSTDEIRLDLGHGRSDPPPPAPRRPDSALLANPFPHLPLPLADPGRGEGKPPWTAPVRSSLARLRGRARAARRARRSRRTRDRR